MSNPWDRPPLPKRGDDNNDTTSAAVGRVLSVWEHIEGQLSHMFALCVGKMWTNEAYDEYYKTGKTTNGRLTTLQEAAEKYFIASPDQEAEGVFCELMKKARLFAQRRHEVAHGIVQPIQWYGSLLPEAEEPPDRHFRFCLVPPHYQRDWIKDGVPEYIYTSAELSVIERNLFSFLHELMDFRWRYLPKPPRPSPSTPRLPSA